VQVPVLRRRARLASWVRLLVLAALPWAWFPLRDLLGVVGDVAAIVLPVLVGLTAVTALVVARRRAVLPAISLLLAGAAAVVAPWSPADAGSVAPGSGITIAGANVTSMPSTLPALRDVAADVLVVAEDDAATDAGLVATYPHQAYTPGVPRGGVYSPATPRVGVYSRFPLQVLELPGPDLPGLRVVVDAPTPFTLYALHVPRPWWTGRGEYQATVAEHHRLVAALARRAARESGPVVLAGDLNSTDRGRDYRLLTDGTRLVDAMRDGWTGPTSVTTWLPFLLRIDHLVVGRGWCGDASRHFPLARSDHDGITATVGPCASTGPREESST
jgi:endonuclease/exonuclease/phosphatase (EEP) superfamily protein YafD